MSDPQNTDYIVLRRSGETWAVVNSTSSRDSKEAIKETYEKLDGSRADDAVPVAAEFVAVPYRSWKRVTVTPKIETTLVLGEAK